MALVTLPIPNMLNGVSQQPDQLRFPTQGDVQENGYSSVVDGLAKRYPTEHVGKLINGAVGSCKVHVINRDDAEQYVVIVRDNAISVYDENGVAQNVTYGSGAQAYLDLDSGVDPAKVFKLLTVADYTFVVNTTKTVAMDTVNLTAARSDWSLLWVAQGAYETKYTVTGTPSGSFTSGSGTSNTTGTHDGESFTAVSNADTALIAARLSASLTLPTNASKSRSGYIINIDKATSSTAILMSVSDGLGGGGLKLVGKSVESFDALPIIAPKGFKTEIVGSADGNEDNYWVEFQNDQSSSGTFGKGTWAETVAPGIQYKFDASTMPHVLVRTGFNNGVANFEFKKADWANREAGDTVTNPNPSFVGEKINQVFMFRGRLGFLAGENVVLSESAEFFNFWRTTVTTVLDTDPIDVQSAYPAVSPLRHAVQFDDRLVIFSDKAQFVLTAPNVLTPSSILMNVVGTYEFLPDCAPTLVGEQIYYGFDRGGHSGVRMVVANQDDTSILLSPDVSANVPKYIKGRLVELLGSSHDNIVVGWGDYDPSVLYVYKWLDSGRERVQASWSSWSFKGAFIRGMGWIKSTLYLVIERPEGLFLERILIEPNRTDPQSGFVTALDRRATPTVASYNATTNRTTFTVPYNVHNANRVRIVTKAVEQSSDYDFNDLTLNLDGNSANVDLNFMLTTVEGGRVFPIVSASGSTVTVAGDARERPCWVGETYDFRYRFSIPYVRQDSERASSAITTGRLQLRNMFLRFVNSSYFKTTIGRRFGGVENSSLYTGNVLGTGQSVLHDIAVDSGTFRVPVLARNDEAIIEITSDSHLPCSFAGAEIEATYDARTQRF